MHVTQRIDRLCVHLVDPDFATMAAGFGADALLARILDAVRAGRLDALAADLDALDQVFAENGIDNVTTGSRSYGGPPANAARLPGCGPGHPSFTALVCSAPQRCARTLLRPVDQVPVCAITGHPLAAREIGT
ncbi:hypothetical protein ACFVMC_25300 [Nocardia sp. NPDC127579]|uniref:hypothetical protein n=1 Tax=Nocardia sp. NPDC127579 TaxID=3345402 RepID=UPI003637089D